MTAVAIMLDSPATTPVFAPVAQAIGLRAVAPLVRLVRPRQWLKNVLLAVPMIAGHQVARVDLWLALALSAIAFCCVASCVYICNDLADLDADRRHPTKRRRPLAAGEVSPASAIVLAALLLIVGVGISLWQLPHTFTGLLVVYLLLSTSYSLWWKRWEMLDVVLLASLYTLRILAGGAASGIAVSDWLMAFAVFLFASLALAKRYVELDRLGKVGGSEVPRRGYRADDIALIGTLGPMCGYLAVLVLALYVQSDEMKAIYAARWPLWIVCLVLMYWIGRLWLLARRGELAEDPVVFATTDRNSLGTGLVVATLLIIAVWQRA